MSLNPGLFISDKVFTIFLNSSIFNTSSSVSFGFLSINDNLFPKLVLFLIFHLHFYCVLYILQIKP